MKGDADHAIPWDRGGNTSTTNLLLLCRHHHRLKTHTRWRVTKLSTGAICWTSPNGTRGITLAGITTRLQT